ncbi:hypothetical protein [Caballeronia sordidicola]|uniref:hypothetical protein n=1 Tax=Caballeronia sordidicola TaxID=196367 RepID=UPI000B79A4AE|nr:hypothetical protein [Caballeronia sordidicola]
MKSSTDGLAKSKTDGDTGTEPLSKNLYDWPWAVIASVLGLTMAGVAYSLGDAYHNAGARQLGSPLLRQL